MENAADALKMGAAILIFIIAIASSFSLFGTAKQTADSIIGMRDKQSYLEAAELDNGILYTSSDSISSGSVSGITKNGDRVVSAADVISTIYRYSKEKYGVTIIKSDDKTVLARFDSNTENVMNQWYNIADVEDITAEEQKENYTNKIKENISTKYVKSEDITLELESLYAINIDGNMNIKCGAPWYGSENEIRERITVELSGGEYIKNGQKYSKETGIIDLLDSSEKIIEVTNEIDNSKYLSDKDDEGNDVKTNLLQQYEMPTVEIVYIVY